MGTTDLRGLSCRAARHGYRPPGEPRVSRARRLHDHRAQAPSLPRYPRGHRLAHHDDQRPGGARLGSGRHRGRGRAAGAARVDAHSAGRGGPPHRKAGRGRDGHGPGAHRHRDAPEEGSRRQVRRVLRSRDPDAAPGGPGDDRQHGSRVWRHRRDLPGGPGDASLPRVHRPEQGAGEPRRGVHEGAGAVPLTGRARAGLLGHVGARLGNGGGEPRRAAATPGSRAVTLRQAELPDAAADPRKADVAHRAPVGRAESLGGRGRAAVRRRNRSGRAAAPNARRSQRRWRGLQAAARLRRDRRDHELHQHVQPVRHGRRRPGGEEGRGARAEVPAVGEDQPRARLEGRDRLSGQGRPHEVPRAAALSSGRLWVHHVHRQRGAASRGRLHGGRRRGAGGVLRAVGEP